MFQITGEGGSTPISQKRPLESNCDLIADAPKKAMKQNEQTLVG